MAGIVTYSGTDRQPAASIPVILYWGPRGSRDRDGETQTDPGGRFEFEGVGPGEHSFATWNRHWNAWETGHAAVQVGEGQTARAELQAARPPAPGEGVPVHGTVRYDDGRIAGTFRFWLRAEGRDYLVSGKDGEFECLLPKPGEYRGSGVEADGMQWETLPADIEAIPGKPVSITLPVPRDVVLAVVDRATGTPLPSARAYRRQWEDSDFVFEDFPNPKSRDGTPFPADGDGRIRIGKLTGEESWFVVADGHAWCRVAIPGGETLVRIPLEPGGTVHLSVAGWAGLADATVSSEFQGPWRRWTLPSPRPDGQAVFQGIPLGTWKFTVRRGWDFRGGEIYGEGSVEVLPGKESRLAIQTKPSKAGASVPVSGTVTIPASWRLKSTRVRLEGSEPTNSSVTRMVFLDLPADGSPVPFKIDPIPPGLYEVQVDPQWYTVIRVQAAAGPFVFKVPGPGTVMVSVVDDATGSPIDQAHVGWFTDAGRSGYGPDSAERTEGAGRFRIAAPAGRVALLVSAPGYVGETREGTDEPVVMKGFEGSIEVREGIESTVTVRLRRGGTVHVTFQWDGEAPNWTLASVLVEVEKGFRRVMGHCVNIKNGEGIVEGVEPGSYRIKGHGLGEEFASIADIPIEVKAGETTEVVVPLVRRK